MFNQNYGQNYYFGNGFNQAQQYIAPKKPRFTNPLSEEDKKALKNQGKFSLMISENDLKKSFCTHKDGDQISLRENGDGTHTCWICGETFTLVENNLEYVTQITKEFLDILQSTKTYYLDAPEGVIKELFQMMPFIDKIPEVFKIAINNFQSYENPMVAPMNHSQQFFGLYDSVASPAYQYNPMMGMTYGQQPMMYQQPAVQPMAQQQPQMMPQGGQQVGAFTYVDNGAPVGATPVHQAPVSPIPQPGNNGTTVTETVQTTKTFSL